MASILIIEEQSDAKDILCVVMATVHVEVNESASVNSHAQNLWISKRDLIDVLL